MYFFKRRSVKFAVRLAPYKNKHKQGGKIHRDSTVIGSTLVTLGICYNVFDPNTFEYQYGADNGFDDIEQL